MKPDITSSKPFDEVFIAAAIAAAPDTAVYDPENPPTHPEDWNNPIVSHSREELLAKLAERRRRGPGKAPRKEPTAIRFDPEVLAGLRATGRGWQTRVNEVMREWLKARSSVQ